MVWHSKADSCVKFRFFKWTVQEVHRAETVSSTDYYASRNPISRNDSGPIVTCKEELSPRRKNVEWIQSRLIHSPWSWALELKHGEGGGGGGSGSDSDPIPVKLSASFLKSITVGVGVTTLGTDTIPLALLLDLGCFLLFWNTLYTAHSPSPFSTTGVICKNFVVRMQVLRTGTGIQEVLLTIGLNIPSVL